MNSLDLAVFDLDGTLVELEYAHFFSEVRRIFPLIGAALPREEDLANLREARRVFHHLDATVREDFEVEFWRRFDRASRPPARLIPEALNTMRVLVERGLEVAIATARDESIEEVIEYLRDVGIMEHTSVLSTFRDRDWIDKTTQLAEICATLKIAPINSVMVGDVMGDIKSASSVGFGLTVGVLSGEYGLDALREVNPDAVLAHVGDLPKLLDIYNHNPSSVKGSGRFFEVRGSDGELS